MKRKAVSGRPTRPPRSDLPGGPDEPLILVTGSNRTRGRAGKVAVHAAGLLHRAFSIFLVDRAGKILLQQRSRHKYHSARLWANTCCGHPRPGERTATAARRRLREELGAEAPLQVGFRTYYRTQLGNGLIENELVHVYFGPAPRTLRFEPTEVAGVAWMTLAALRADLRRRPRRYAYWLRHYLERHLPELRRGLRAAARRDQTVPGALRT
jgi:isopentenyl-diphosphate delta-isomerase